MGVRPYLQRGSLQAIVDHLCVEMLFLHLLLQLGDTSLQPPLLICQQSTSNNKGGRGGAVSEWRHTCRYCISWPCIFKVHTMQFHMTKCTCTVDTEVVHIKLIYWKNIWKVAVIVWFILLAIAAVNLVLKLISLGLKLFLESLCSGQILKEGQDTSILRL